MSTFWGCAESYRGSGRPSRIWAIETTGPDTRPDDADENGHVAYPFNGMGGSVVTGPFPTEAEAEEAAYAQTYVDEDGYWHWR